MLYDPKLHGQWAIVDKGGKLTVSQESVADAGVEGFASLKRIVMKAQSEDVLRKVVRVDPNTFAALRGIKRSRHLIVTIKGKHTTVAKCELADDFKGPGILMDKVTRQNACTQIAETVDIAAVKVADASRVTLASRQSCPSESDSLQNLLVKFSTNNLLLLETRYSFPTNEPESS
jgi:hypothetical protein